MRKSQKKPKKSERYKNHSLEKAKKQKRFNYQSVLSSLGINWYKNRERKKEGEKKRKKNGEKTESIINKSVLFSSGIGW